MKGFKSVVAVLCAVAVVVSSYAPASAVSSAALSIVPKKNYTVEAGKSVKDVLTVRNLDEREPLILSLRVVDFTFNDDGGTPKLMLAEDAPQTTWSLKPFLTVPKSVTIPPKSSKTLDMSVKIPAGHGAGSYYSAIVYSSGASEGGNVGLSASGVTLVFTQIPGLVNEDLKLQKFGAYKQAESGKTGSYLFFATEPPEMIAYTLKNNGNVTEAPVGSIKIKHMFGSEQTISNVNPNSSLALIGQTRTFTSCIKLEDVDVNFSGSRARTSTCVTPSLWPGRYSLSLNLFYGQNGNNTQEIFGAGSFWYLPIWFIILVLIVLAVIAYFVWKTVRKVKGVQQRSRSKKPIRRRR